MLVKIESATKKKWKLNRKTKGKNTLKIKGEWTSGCYMLIERSKTRFIS